jgi:hypothetical protein
VANVASVLAPGGVLFGATVLGEAGPHTWLARRVLHAFNRQGGFDNLDDSETAVRAMLEAAFRQVKIEIVGSVAIFEARDPIRSAAESGSPGPGSPLPHPGHPDPAAHGPRLTAFQT